MFTEETKREISAVAANLGIEAAALLAVVEVESGGRTSALVAGKPEPLIRFEGHYFDRRLSAANRIRARAEGLASPVPGAVANPKTQAGRWALLAKARAIDAWAANESVSWGLGQVMGAHWAWLGYSSVDALVAEARSNVSGQARLMARYIERAGLLPAIRARHWEAFARGYNGPQYKRFDYHSKIAAAYKRYSSTEIAATPTLPSKKGAAPAKPLVPPHATPPSVSSGTLWSRLMTALHRLTGRV